MRSVFLLATLFAVAMAQCQWPFAAYEGQSMTFTLQKQWNCSGILTVQTSGDVLPGLTIPYMRNPVIQYLPPFGSRGQQNQALTITCNFFTPVCTNAYVYFYVRPSDQTTPAPPPTTTTTTAAPTTTTTTTTTTLPPLPPGSTYPPTTVAPSTTTAAPTTPAPTPSGPVFCLPLPDVYLNTSTTTLLYPMNYVSNCVSAKIAFRGNTTSALFSIAADGTTLVVDQYANNTVQSVYEATLSITCGGIEVCVLSQRAVISAPPVFTPAPSPAPLPSCLPVYAYECIYGVQSSLSLAGQPGATACPSSNSTVMYRLIAAPTANAANFSFDSVTGNFVYLAPSVATVDAFSFAIQCDSVDLCSTKAFLVSTRNTSIQTPSPSPPPTATTSAPTTPTPAPVPLPACSGVYSYVFTRLVDGTLPPQQGSLFFPPGGSVDCTQFANATIRAMPYFGTVTIADPSTGIFTYTVTTAALDWDNFTFALQCSASDTVPACEGRAKILVQNYTGPTLPPTPVPTTRPPFYHVADNLYCSGTCNGNGWVTTDINKTVFDVTTDDLGRPQPSRMDKQPLDKVVFGFANNYDVRMEVFTLIGNMGARFPTFEPIPTASGLFTATSAAQRNTGFNATCLGKQSRYGNGYELWEWTNFSNLVGNAAGSYASRYNYFQKFGGKHVDCDTFRNDACTYAPLLTPATNVSNGVSWFLIVRDCDATWVGEASLTTLRSLKSSTGASLFTPKGDKQIVGQLTTEAVKPASWLRPTDGILTTSKTYDVILTTRLLVQSTATTVGYVAPTTTVPPAPTTTTTAAPSTTTTTTVAPVVNQTTSTANATMAPDVSSATVAPNTTTTTTTTAALNTTTAIPDTTTTTAPNTTTTMAPNTTTTVAPNTTTAAPVPTLPSFATDIIYTITTDPVSNERLYRYNVLIYPPSASAVNFSAMYVSAVRLQNYSWRAPVTCPECAGTVFQCVGNGVDLGDACLNMSFVQFAAGDTSSVSCPNSTVFPAVAGVSNVALCPQTLFNVSILARVAGRNSANSVGQPEGTLNVLVDFSNGQTIAVSLAQESYVSQIDSAAGGTPGLVTRVCRSTEYYPVVDLLGTSVATVPYQNPAVAAVSTDPRATASVCPRTSSANTPATGLTDATTQDYSVLCRQPDERVFGISETVLVQFDAMGISNATFDYVTLTVSSTEVVPHPLQQEFSFLLAGSIPTHERFYRRSILPWSQFASSLAVRQNGQIISFIPGALLRAASSKVVKFTLEASLTSAISGTTEVRLIIPISKSVDASTRNEPIINVKYTNSDSSLDEANMTSLFIVLGLGGLCAVVAGVAIMTNDEQKELILEQHRTVKKYIFGEKKKSSGVAAAPSSTPSSVRAAPSSPNTAAPSKKGPAGKALTPAAVRAREEMATDAPSARQGSPTTRSPTTRTPTTTRPGAVSPQRVPEVEQRRVRNDDEEAS